MAFGRRGAMLGMAGAALATTADFSAPAEGLAKETAQVGTYLPKADIDGFNLFVPDRSKTPVGHQCTLIAPVLFRFRHLG